MRIETFFEQFDKLAETPDAHTALRELIVQSAVRGRLVPNSPADRPVRMDMSGSVHEASWPRNWKAGTLGDAVQLEYGENLPAGKRSGSGEYPVYGSNGVVGTHDRYLTKQPTIVVGRKGSAGALTITDGPSWTTDVAYFVRLPSDLDLRFTYYLLSSLHLDELGKGIKPGLNRKEAYELPIAVPPFAEQQRIVARVDQLMALCDRLEAQRQEREKRELALAQASLMRFADAPTTANLGLLFHPSYRVSPSDLRRTIRNLAVEGRLMPQNPDDDPPQRAFPGLAESNPESGAGMEVPSQWAVSTYRGLTSLVTSGSRGWKEFYSRSGALFIRTQNIRTDRLILDDVAFVQLPQSAEGMRAQVLKDDIMITITGANVTKAARVDDNIPEAYVSQHIALTRPRWPQMSKWLHLCFVSHRGARGTLERLAYGDKPGLNLDNIRDLVFLVPPLAEQHRIVAKVDQLIAQVDELEAQVASSRVTGESLLSALVNDLTGKN